MNSNIITLSIINNSTLIVVIKIVDNSNRDLIIKIDILFARLL